jgi:putative phosphoesterase
VAALYDIHGNLPALEAVLDEVRAARVDAVVIGGDVVPGPMPRESLRLLQSLDLPVRFIRGNGDREVLAVMRGEEPMTVPEPFRPLVRWNAGQLEGADARTLANWPPTTTIDVPGIGPVLFCHATPESDTAIFTELTPAERLRPLVEGLGDALVVCGHTHMPFDRTVGRVRIVNAGSVGMPFGEPGADWILIGPDVAFRHTTYDLSAAAERIRRTAYPQADEFAERHVLKPPAAKDMLAAFEKAASIQKA